MSQFFRPTLDQTSPRKMEYTDAPVSNIAFELQWRDSLISEQQSKIERLTKELEQVRAELSAMQTKQVPKEIKQGKTSRYWSDEEHQRFLQAMEKYGSKNVKAIAQYVGTRSATQVRTHAQKYFLKLKRERERSRSMSSSSGNMPLNTSGGSAGSVVARSTTPDHMELSNEMRNSSETSVESMEGGWGGLSSSPLTSPMRRKRNSWRSHSATDSKELSNEEYDRFMQGLEATKTNKDFDRRCKIIRDLYLSDRSLEEVRNWAQLMEKTTVKREAPSMKETPFRPRTVRGRAQTDPMRLVAPLAPFTPSTLAERRFSRERSSSSAGLAEGGAQPWRAETAWTSYMPSPLKERDERFGIGLTVKQEPISPELTFQSSPLQGSPLPGSPLMAYDMPFDSPVSSSADSPFALQSEEEAPRYVNPSVLMVVDPYTEHND